MKLDSLLLLDKEFQEEASKFINKYNSKEDPMIYLKNIVKVKLLGDDGIEVVNISNERQLIRSDKPLEWLWTLKPQDCRTSTLTLQLFGIFEIAGSEVEQEFISYNYIRFYI